MKKFILLLLLIFNHFVLFAAPNYNNGNGTILFESVEGNKKTVVRKCEMEVTIGEKLGKKSRIIYDRSPNNYSAQNQHICIYRL